MALKVSPLAPEKAPDLPAIDGVLLATAATGIKYTNRDDLLLVTLDEGSICAGVLTKSGTASAPVSWCRHALTHDNTRGLLVNAGNANAFTGSPGEEHVRVSCETAASQIGCQSEQVMVASTGVIGELLPIEKILQELPTLAANLAADGWKEAAQAILTTDTFAKVATKEVQIAGETVRINGIAKGSGMIEPNMATMLAFIFTDANVTKTVLESLLVEANEQSFNSITVDSDTSTSDTCLLFSSRRAGHARIESEDAPELNSFKESLNELMQDLAIQVVRDGEGASKLIQIDVTGADNDILARQVAKAIANSPLVKTAIAGEDANWGRVIMAVGKSGVPIDQNKIKLYMGGVQITENGSPLPNYDEGPVAQHLKGQEISIKVELGEGAGRARVWTCDLTHGYIEINADYRS